MRARCTKIILVGAGHAHLYSLARLDAFVQAGAEVVVVSPAPFWYSGMGPGLLSGEYGIDDASVDVRDMVEQRGGRFIEGKLASIDAHARKLKMKNGIQLDYDVLSLNIGSVVRPPFQYGDGQRVFPVKPVSCFLELRRAMLDLVQSGKFRLVIVGGGPAGCEAAANARAVCVKTCHAAAIHIITSGQRLLPEMNLSVARRMLDWCRENEVVVETGKRVMARDDSGVVCDDGTTVAADIVVAATGVHPTPLLEGSGLTINEDGAMVVGNNLQSVSHEGVFGGGDCIDFQSRPLARIGVHAVREAPILFQNILAAVTGGDQRVYVPHRNHLLILNLGDGTGLLTRGGLCLAGRLPFLIKKRLDRRFICHYQQASIN